MFYSFLKVRIFPLPFMSTVKYMLDHIRQSLEQTLHDRIKSPFAGAFILSWLTWNWRIPYYIFFSENTLSIEEKIEYIETNLIHTSTALNYPFLVAILIVVLYPLITTGAIWITLRYKKVQNHIEGLFPITQEEARELRFAKEKLKIEFGELLKAKDTEIEFLNTQLSDTKSIPKVEHSEQSNAFKSEFSDLLSRHNFSYFLNKIIEAIHNDQPLSQDSKTTASMLEAAGFIIAKPEGKPYFYFTEKGNALVTEYMRGNQY